MKFLTIRRAGMGSISIPLDRVSSISAHGNVSRVDYARADGTLDYTFDDRAPSAVLHEIDAMCAHAPAAEAVPRGFVELTLGYTELDYDGTDLLIPVDAIRGVQSSVKSGESDNVAAWVILDRASVQEDIGAPIRTGDDRTIGIGVRESFAEIGARLAGATR